MYGELKNANPAVMAQEVRPVLSAVSLKEQSSCEQGRRHWRVEY